jgi:CheY-like chemotaxis protein
MEKVLIVEDDLLLADLLQEMLELDGYTVTAIARTKQEAIAAASECKPDCAVVDVQLANGDRGTEVAALLQAMGNVKILFSTGNDPRPGLTAGSGSGIMAKPYSVGDVGRALRIIDDIARFGETIMPFPRKFRLLAAAPLPVRPPSVATVANLKSSPV